MRATSESRHRIRGESSFHRVVRRSRLLIDALEERMLLAARRNPTFDDNDLSGERRRLDESRVAHESIETRIHPSRSFPESRPKRT
jgi:hypothetical protein